MNGPDSGGQLQEWQHHIRHTHTAQQGQAWCGANCLGQWNFQDLDHAAYSLRNGDRMQPCPACLEAARAVLGSYEGAQQSGEAL